MYTYMYVNLLYGINLNYERSIAARVQQQQQAGYKNLSGTN